MKFIYVHHAERDKNDSVEWNEHGITANGKIEAEFFNKYLIKYKDIYNIGAVYTSNYFRCVETAKIVSEGLLVPIIEEPDFNEKAHSLAKNLKSESWLEFLQRNINALDRIYNKHKNSNQNVIIVTSGVNLSAFICYFYNIPPSETTPYSGALRMSPVWFEKKD